MRVRQAAENQKTKTVGQVPDMSSFGGHRRQENITAFAPELSSILRGELLVCDAVNRKRLAIQVQAALSQLKHAQAVAQRRLLQAVAAFPNLYRSFVEEWAFGVPETRLRDDGTCGQVSRSRQSAGQGMQRIGHLHGGRVLTARPLDPAAHFHVGVRIPVQDRNPDFRFRGIQDVVPHEDTCKLRHGSVLDYTVTRSFENPRGPTQLVWSPCSERFAATSNLCFRRSASRRRSYR